MDLVDRPLSEDQEEESIKSLARFVDNSALGKMKRRLLFDDKRSFMVLPDIYREDLSYKAFMKGLYKELNPIFSSGKILPDGFYKDFPGIADDLDRLRYLPGMGRPYLNFGRERPQLDMSEEFKKHVSLVVNVLLEGYEETSGKITRESSSGFPFFSNEHVVKLAHLNVLSQNIDLFVELQEKKDRVGLLNKLGVSYVSNTQIRLQTDSFRDGAPKPRPIVPFDVAYHHRDVSFKDVVKIDDFFNRCRTRVVCAMPGLVNNMFSSVFEGYKKYMFNTYSKTFRHCGKDDVYDKMSRFKHVIGSDIVSFDTKAPENLILEIIDNMPFTDFGKDVLYDLLYGPFFCSDVDGFQSCRISEDWKNKKYSTWKGMPSGIFFTTVLNCIEVVVIKTWEFSRFYPELLTKEGLVRWLNHELDIASLIMSDDNQDMFNDYDVYNHYLSGGYEAMLIPIEVEYGFSFLGIKGYKDEDDNIKVSNSPISYLVHQYIPERPARSYHRPYPVLGLVLREQEYKSIPRFDDIKEIENKLWHDLLGINREQYIAHHLKIEMAELSRKEVNLSKYIHDLTDIEKEVLADPTKIHYKYNENDVRSEVLQMIAERVPEVITERLRCHLIKNNNNLSI